LIAPSQKNNHITLRAHKIQRLTFKSALIAVKNPTQHSQQGMSGHGKKAPRLFYPAKLSYKIDRE
jgi:hypothetical protein